MNKGRKTCDVLKAIRAKIAEANGIDYEYTECTFEGECLGTCPKCQSEVESIERQLLLKSCAGESVKLKGVASDILDNRKELLNLNYEAPKDTLPILIIEGMDDKIEYSDSNQFLSVKGEIDDILSDFALNNPDCEIERTTIPVSDNCQSEIEEYLVKNQEIKYAPVIILMVNSESKVETLLEIKELMESSFYKMAMKVAFKTDANTALYDRICSFTGSQEAVWSYSQVQELLKVLRVIRLHRFSDDYLTGDIIANPNDHVTSGLPLIGDIQSSEYNDGYDEWD